MQPSTLLFGIKSYRRGVSRHFIQNNESTERQLYTFDLLVPSQYDAWFSNLKKGREC